MELGLQWRGLEGLSVYAGGLSKVRFAITRNESTCRDIGNIAKIIREPNSMTEVKSITTCPLCGSSLQFHVTDVYTQVTVEPTGKVTDYNDPQYELTRLTCENGHMAFEIQRAFADVLSQEKST